MVLSEKQKIELYTYFIIYRNEAIFIYLSNYSEYNESAKIFQKEAKLEKINPLEIFKQNGIILEKKWSTIIRLEKRIMDLEKEINILKNEQNSLNSNSLNSTNSTNSTNLIRNDPKYTLNGHKGTINVF